MTCNCNSLHPQVSLPPSPPYACGYFGPHLALYLFYATNSFNLSPYLPMPLRDYCCNPSELVSHLVLQFHRLVALHAVRRS